MRPKVLPKPFLVEARDEGTDVWRTVGAHHKREDAENHLWDCVFLSDSRASYRLSDTRPIEQQARV